MTRRHLTIPECRGVLLVIADHLDKTRRPNEARHIRDVVEHMKRRRPVRMTRPRSPPVTPAIKAKIRELARTTDKSQMAIGLQVGVNSGRVSETLAGKRR